MSEKTTQPPSCDCLCRCGDDGRVQKGLVPPCAHYLQRQAEARATEVLHWVPPTPTTLPNTDRSVLVELDGCRESVWIGFWTGAEWQCASTGGRIACQVTGWAEMPKGRSR